MKDESEEVENRQETELEGVKPRDLRTRLRDYSLRILTLYDSLPKSGAIHIITHQLARSGTSPGAQYREACRAKSDADFISKIEGAIQELDESDYWLELMGSGGYAAESRLAPLIDETDQLISIFVTMVNKVKRRKKHSN